MFSLFSAVFACAWTRASALVSVVVCVRQVTVPFSLCGLDGVSPHADMGKGQGGTEKAPAEVALLPGNLSQP